MAEFLGLALEEFGLRYLRRVGARYALLESPLSGDCVFLRGKECAVYTARPGQCRRFPWWPQHLASPEAWDAAARECEGIGHDAPLVPRARIEAALDVGDDP
jgi:hypothetical protein